MDPKDVLMHSSRKTLGKTTWQVTQTYQFVGSVDQAARSIIEQVESNWNGMKMGADHPCLAVVEAAAELAQAKGWKVTVESRCYEPQLLVWNIPPKE